jgi:DNA invertase Pin-like site-specific DNA recombinase
VKGKPGRPRAVVPWERIVVLRSEGFSLRQIARTTGLGAGTVRRALQAAPHTTAVCQNPSAGASGN